MVNYEYSIVRERIIYQEIIPFVCFQKIYAIQIVNLIIIVEEIIQEYGKNHILKYYGCNDDTQRLICNRTWYDTWIEKNIEYEDFVIMLKIHGYAGLE